MIFNTIKIITFDIPLSEIGLFGSTSYKGKTSNDLDTISIRRIY